MRQIIPETLMADLLATVCAAQVEHVRIGTGKSIMIPNSLGGSRISVVRSQPYPQGYP